VQWGPTTRRIRENASDQSVEDGLGLDDQVSGDQLQHWNVLTTTGTEAELAVLRRSIDAPYECILAQHVAAAGVCLMHLTGKLGDRSTRLVCGARA
jgi:hypothetical protein